MSRSRSVPPVSRAHATRFWAKVRVSGPDDCWEWQSSRNRGYGRFSMDGHNYRSHRVAYRITKGHIPNGFCIMHKCDNPPCCNPQHLRLGTIAENNRDMSAKKRIGKVLGRRNGAAALGPNRVREIRKLYATGQYSMRILGNQFGVSHQTIFETVSGKRWRHVV